jgi:hypothetical protein
VKYVEIDSRGLREIDAGPGSSHFKGIPEDRLPKSIWRYIELECGHLTTPEAQELVRLWRPKRSLYYCDHWPKPCGWVKLKPKPKPKETSDEPLF